jgi:predicted XRE-type DNA-binding protein
MTGKADITAGSGNIFADLNLPGAETHFLKAQIVSEIYRLTMDRKLIQVQAGSVAHVQGALPRILDRPADGVFDGIRPQR